MSNVMYLKKKKEMMDPETGELQSMECLIRLWSADRKFVKLFDAFAADIVMDKELSGKPIRLLLYLARVLPYNEDEVHIVPRRVMKDLQISKTTLWRWIDVLVKKGILKKIALNVYQVKPYAFIRGSMSQTLNDKEYDHIKNIKNI